ncbi:MAG: hypothetical protein JNK37_13285 [Verrucomicrobiales bacterium]|nr:hypothetical protein [Verrucomicrobiales bacterium]
MTIQDQHQDNEDGLEWLRDIRRKMSAECNHDPHLLIEKLRAMEKLPQYAHRIVRVRKVLEPVKP